MTLFLLSYWVHHDCSAIYLLRSWYFTEVVDCIDLLQ